jgi:hypothetical protein
MIKAAQSFSQSRPTCIYSSSLSPLLVGPPPWIRPTNGIIRTHTPSTPRPRRLWRWRRRPRIRRVRRRVLLVLGSKEPRLTPEAQVPKQISQNTRKAPERTDNALPFVLLPEIVVWSPGLLPVVLKSLSHKSQNPALDRLLQSPDMCRCRPRPCPFRSKPLSSHRWAAVLTELRLPAGAQGEDGNGR